MVYRISATLIVYHFILMILSGLRNKKVYQITDYCWTFKIIAFLWIFFITCTIRNSIFSYIGMVSKYLVCLFIVIKFILLHDALFYYYNSQRFN